MNQSKSSYHHGDLRSSLLAAATAMITEGGIEALSMRKLADRVGVSRTAPYHHFADKQELLSAIAETGFHHYEAGVNRLLAEQSDPGRQVSGFIEHYVNFALEQPQAYNLMFGQSVWKSGEPSESLKTEAYRVFRQHVRTVESWQAADVMPSNVDTLRLAQISWATLHGLSRLILDGIYVDRRNLGPLLRLAESMFRQSIEAAGEPD
ncbi:TetR family transcriptional regulator [Marinobacterium nitratireducens]|uniref:TetR family transcriptional regulator n=1 Tax=Marinobacterium nitratireducens TaxID=518897 RepID=A0A918DQN1_9GAMM|nr:TetR/AcrR family transcriptional regulator [Marinobacterium nitratireducens]GGO78902.1 TetR family transcriptional regulator [Marinobacterium nitratireducens]